MNEPLVSVIIPCYNQARFVKQAVASCFAQTYAAVQVIVIDDGSTDDPRAALQEFCAHPNLKLLRQENRGVAHARNAGIAASSGIFLKFLDADDWLEPTIVRKQVDTLSANPKLGFVYCDTVRVNEHGEPIERGRLTERGVSLDGDLFPLLLLDGFFPPLTVMLPRAVLDHVGDFDQNVAPCEDYDLWLRIAAHGYPAQFLNEPLVYYRRHEAGASQDRVRLAGQQRAVLRKIAAQYPERLAEALFEIGVEFNALNGERAGALTRETQQREWISQLERDKAALQRAADTRETYLKQIESFSLFRGLVRAGILPRRTELENRKS